MKYLKYITLVGVAILMSIIMFQGCENRKLTNELAATKIDCQFLTDAKQSRIEDQLFSIDSLKAANAEATARIEELEMTKPTIKYLTKVKTDTEVVKQLVTMRDSLSSKQQELINSLATMDSLSLDVEALRDILASHVCEPIYKSSYKDDYLSLDIEACEDSTKFNLALQDQIEIKHEIKRRFLAKDIHTVTARTLSPYSKATEVQSISFKEKQKKFGLGITVGYGLNADLTAGPTVSLGATYNLLPLK